MAENDQDSAPLTLDELRGDEWWNERHQHMLRENEVGR